MRCPYSFFKLLLVLMLALVAADPLFAQNKAPQDFGFRYLQMPFQQDPVNILVLSQKGQEQKKKPLLLFIQGSLPIPLIIYDEQGVYGTFPFRTTELLQHYHLAIVGKPFIPVVIESKYLPPNFTFLDPDTGHFPLEYSERNILDYYVARNLAVISYLKEQPWVSNQQLVLAGHSEGSTIAAKMATLSTDVTHLIYSGGNPLGRIMTFIAKARAVEDSQAESDLLFWQYVVNNSESLDGSEGDTPKTTYQFSLPPLHNLLQLEIPVLVTYGTKDTAAIFNDYLRVETMRQQNTNFTYKAYPALEHNYFGLTPTGEIDYNNYNWDKVVQDWLEWLQQPARK
jgi:dienelactone hydrolase